MAKNSGIDARSSKTVKLNVYPRRRVTIFFVLIAMTCFFSYLIARAQLSHNFSWVVIALPISLLGFMTIFLSPVEEWSYAPWQDASTKYEKNVYN